MVSKSRFFGIVVVSIIICSTTLLYSQDTIKVTRVIDGDTIELENGEKVRLIGIDTPETVHPNKPVEYFGKEATKFTRDLLEGKVVNLKYDEQKRDKYNRLLAYVYLEDLLVNAELIKQGYAHAYTKYPFKQEYMDLFRLLEKEARESENGLWAKEASPPEPVAEKYWLNSKSNTLHNSSCRWYGNTKQGYYTNKELGRDCGICGGVHRQAKATQIKPKSSDDGITVYVTKTGKKYHRPGCRYLKKSAIPISLPEAKRRYSPCSVCKPPR